MKAHCTKDRCWFSAATCKDHEQMPNTKKELLDGLKQQKIRNNLFAVPATGPVLKSGKIQEAENEMSDTELTNKLNKELAKSTKKSNLDVNLLPPGGGIFMFTLLRGKNDEKIQTIIDT